jgi:hypothetical protein
MSRRQRTISAFSSAIFLTSSSRIRASFAACSLSLCVHEYPAHVPERAPAHARELERLQARLGAEAVRLRLVLGLLDHQLQLLDLALALLGLLRRRLRGVPSAPA